MIKKLSTKEEIKSYFESQRNKREKIGNYKKVLSDEDHKHNLRLDRKNLDIIWEYWINEAKNGNVNRQKLSEIMHRYNEIDLVLHSIQETKLST